MRIITADWVPNLPFVLGEQKVRYSGLWRAQEPHLALPAVTSSPSAGASPYAGSMAS